MVSFDGHIDEVILVDGVITRVRIADDVAIQNLFADGGSRLKILDPDTDEQEAPDARPDQHR